MKLRINERTSGMPTLTGFLLNVLSNVIGGLILFWITHGAE